MTMLYQPISRTFGQRDGCLTPSHHNEKSSASSSGINKLITTDHEILSPPLSPYQKSAYHEPVVSAHKQYLPTAKPFKIEDYKSYVLTLNPWNSLGSSYKRRQLRFLHQYACRRTKEQLSQHLAYLADRRAAHNRKRTFKKVSSSVSSDSENDTADERIRTRRVVKEVSAPLSEIDMDSPLGANLPMPKKRKVRKEPAYVGSPLAAQQAALIDESIPDFLPDPETSLPKGNIRCLKVEWKGQPMDLKDDPNVDKLHPAEVVLASTLRLPGNVYLDSKRRLFYEKVNRLRADMPFRRTDAQKACRIDVNKASRLFAAFEKAGWLEDSHFKKFL